MADATTSRPVQYRAARARLPGRPCILLVAAVAALASLTTTAEARQTRLKTEVIAAENINPSRRGTPQPVKIHVFYLAQSDAFLAANFAELVDPSSAALGDELVRRAERLIGPGELVELDEEFDEAARFIGVIAEFTEVEQAMWRAVEAVPARRWTDVLRLWRSSKLEILVDGTTVSCAIVED